MFCGRDIAKNIYIGPREATKMAFYIGISFYIKIKMQKEDKKKRKSITGDTLKITLF